jgi:hypothetical protein
MDIQNIAVSDSLAQDDALTELVNSRSIVLQDEIPNATAKAEWDKQVDARGRPLLILALRDSFAGESTKTFAPVELEPHYDQHLRERLRGMHGAMLRVGQSRARIAGLYSDIREWLATVQPPVLIDEYEVRLNEELSGPYSMPALSIRRGNRSIEVQPIAIWVVGAQGRVDIVGPTDRRILVDDGQAWQIVTDDFQRYSLPLDANVFRQAINFLLA